MKVKARLLSLLFFALACAIAVSAQGGPGGGGNGGGGGQGGGGGETTGFGNNLSYPVVFAEGYGVTGAQIIGISWTEPFSATMPTPGDATGLRPLTGETYTVFPSFVEPYPTNPLYYAQNTVNTWRAQWAVGTPNTPEQVQVDWGDNLISQSWTATQPVRVETVLRQALTTPMIGYPMASLLGSRRNEIQGTTGETYESLGRTVYSITGHLIIQKYDATWTSVIPNGCSVDKAVYNAAEDGPGAYAAEVNVSGTLIYGYNWMLSQCSAAPDTTKTGNWKITFLLDPNATVGGLPVAPNATITSAADLSTNITKVSFTPNSSSLEITILATRPKGGKGRSQ